MNREIPSESGVYTLIVKVTRTETIKIGKLGSQSFPEGYYTYTGSALGKGPFSLKGRIKRHLARQKKGRWHIDYLLNSKVAMTGAVVYSETSIKKECQISQNLEGLEGAKVVLKGFGASDCRGGCQAHLHHFPDTTYGKLLQSVSTVYRKGSLTPHILEAV